MIRAEASGGTENDEWSGAGAVLPGFSLSSRWDLDGRYAVFGVGGTRHELGLGATVKLGSGWIVRPAFLSGFEQGESTRVWTAQLYYDFSRTL
jgi:hypothetical protein